MQTVVKYRASDGTLWDTEAEAATRDELDAAVKRIEATLMPHPERGRIRQNRDAMAAAKVAVVELCRRIWSTAEVFRHDPAIIHPMSAAGRIIDDSHSKPIKRIWWRFQCWDGEWEYEQPYYALNPGSFEKEYRA